MGERLRRTSARTTEEPATAAPARAGVGSAAAMLALQRSAGNAATLAHLQRKATGGDTGSTPAENVRGLPDPLRSGIENLSGFDLSDVKVHYNSSEPRAISAGAFAQGSDIHLAPGQEQHLPHEAAHIVQQRHGVRLNAGDVAGLPIGEVPR